MYKYIYKITNKINNKVYIGQTKDISRRFREHRQCGYNQVKNKILYNAIRKYGVENFFFEVLEYTVNSVNQGRYHYKEKYTYPIRKRQQPVETMEGQSSSTPTIDTQGETGIAANNN